jgi:hypothetical protein
MIRSNIVVAAGLAVAAALPAGPAHSAARDRVFVASYGSDSNPCTFGSPCKTFQNAVNVVAPKGEVTAIDSAGFGPIIINKSVTITSPAGVEASIATPAGDNAITISAGSSDVVVLRGLTLEGAATGSGGIAFGSGGGLEITDCVIRNFTNTGIFIGPGGNITPRVLIANTKVLDNAVVGIDLQPETGAAITASFDHVTVTNNNDNIFLNSLVVSSITATITNSVIDNSSTTGVTVMSAGTGSEAFLSIKDSSISNNSAATALAVSGTFSHVVLSRTMLNNNNTGISISDSGVVLSAGNNDMTENSTPVTGGSLGSAQEQ